LRSPEKIIDHFIVSLKNHFSSTVKFQYKYPALEIRTGKEKLTIHFFKESPLSANSLAKHILPIDLVATKEKQLIATIQSQLQLNKKVFARNCIIKKVNNPEAKLFLNQYHLMSYAASAYHIGLFLKDELIGIASFSKGRKMNRLEANQRSFELVRFCCKEGITVTGGLSKLIAHFVHEKKPGDIMTYIDKQFGEGKSYITCGFKKHSETPQQQFLINKKTFERTYYKSEAFDKTIFYVTENSGNIKLVYTP